jgi:hypothetical protein
MDDLIGRLVACAGADRTAADKAVDNILQFRAKEGPSDAARVHLLRTPVHRVPGADAAMPASSSSTRSPRIYGAIGLMAAGSSMGRIEAVTRTTLKFARVRAGDDAVGASVGAIPGLG